MSESKRKWTFTDWSKTYDAIFGMHERSANTNDDRLRYSKMLVDHCKIYDRKWNRGGD